MHKIELDWVISCNTSHSNYSMPKLPMHRRNTKFKNIINQIICHFEFLVSLSGDESSHLTATVSYNKCWEFKNSLDVLILTVISLAIKRRPDNRSTRRRWSRVTVTAKGWRRSRRKRWQLIMIPWVVVIGSWLTI